MGDTSSKDNSASFPTGHLAVLSTHTGRHSPTGVEMEDQPTNDLSTALLSPGAFVSDRIVLQSGPSAAATSGQPPPPLVTDSSNNNTNSVYVAPVPASASPQTNETPDGSPDISMPAPNRRRPSELEAWQFPGWGQTSRLVVNSPRPSSRSVRPESASPAPIPSPSPQIGQSNLSKSDSPARRRGTDSPSEEDAHNSGEHEAWESGTVVFPHAFKDHKEDEHKLGQFTATAIAGNDILSSVLYTAGLCGSAAGVFAPISMLMIVCMLYLFRKVYGEVGSALPLNGGAYNALLNTTSKATASVAACLTILSYVSTGVVSAADACMYLQNVWQGMNVYAATIILLCAFALLNFMGLTESAVVALVIFVFHTAVLILLMVYAIVFVCSHGFGVLVANYHSPLQPPIGRALVYGFSAASLGITGFETSSNYIEEQKEGVFPKTLRNMWWVVLIFNPTLAFLAFCVVDIATVMNPDQQAVVLSTMAKIIGGSWFEILVSIDAFLVLSGSVLTAYVGVTGLVKRLAGDRCLPSFFLHTNSWRHTNHFIIFGFLGVCCSLYGVVQGEVADLAGVYSIAFLCVMSLFAIANMLLKYKRNELPRNIRASWPGVMLAFVCVFTALVITAVRNVDFDKWFAIYFFATACLFAISFNRVQILKFLLYMTRYILRNTRFYPAVDAYITKTIADVNRNPVVFFSKTSKLSVLNKAILYIRDNELTNYVRIVHVAMSEDKVPSDFVKNVEIIDSIYPKLRIDAVILQGEFGPDAIETVSHEYGIPKNMVFMTCPTTNFGYKIGSLGGVRVITHSTSD